VLQVQSKETPQHQPPAKREEFGRNSTLKQRT
jgi:hypothetical protein